jgi:hypothetical protein
VAITFATYILLPFYPHSELPLYAPQLLSAVVISQFHHEKINNLIIENE